MRKMKQDYKKLMEDFLKEIHISIKTAEHKRFFIKPVIHPDIKKVIVKYYKKFNESKKKENKKHEL